MKLKVPKNILDKAIKSVSKAVPNKGIQPILNNILLENEDGHLKLNATDLDFSIEAIIPSENQEIGKITLSAKKLEEIVSKLDEDDVLIDVNPENQKTHLICKESNFDLVGIPADDFPKITKPDTSAYISISKERFSKIINLVQFSASRYDLNNILGGIFFGLRENTNPEISSKFILEVAATDGNRLSSYEYEITDANCNPNFAKKEVVVPLKVITDVQRILDTSYDETIRISFIGNQIVFFTDDRFISSRLLEGTYPRYKQLIPSDQDKIAQIDRKQFLSCLERVAIMANEITNLVKLSFNSGKLKIESSNQDFGQAADSIDINYVGDPIVIYFNVKFLIDPIKTIDSDKIQFSMSGPINPVIVKPIASESYIHLVMPIKHEG
jgi:DNA polymerase-3 subunit beta